MEIYLILGVILLQVYIFFQAFYKIDRFKNALPDKKRIIVSFDEEFLDKDDVNSPIIERHQIETSFSSATFDNIRASLNQYLQVNKGATANMNLMKSIVDRNVLKLENEISALIPLPLYLGLMGTMGGIIIGLFQIPSVESSSFSDGLGIDVLIEGVKYAMIASAIGVFFTSILSGWIFRSAKYVMESKVNDLLTFLETELLPILKEDVSANLHNLYQNLAKFNHRFTSGVDQLHEVMEKNHQAVLSQVNLIEELKRIDINELAGANVRVFQEMKELMPQFQLLAGYVKNINSSFEKSTQLSDQISKVIDRTSEVKSLVEFLQDSTNQAIAVNGLIEKHFEELDLRNQKFIMATNGMESTAKQSIDHFKTFVVEQIDALKELTRKEEDLMIKAFEKNRGVLEKLNELSEIKEYVTQISNFKIGNYDSYFEQLIKATISRQGNLSKNGNRPKTNIFKRIWKKIRT